MIINTGRLLWGRPMLLLRVTRGESRRRMGCAAGASDEQITRSVTRCSNLFRRGMYHAFRVSARVCPLSVPAPPVFLNLLSGFEPTSILVLVRLACSCIKSCGTLRLGRASAGRRRSSQCSGSTRGRHTAREKRVLRLGPAGAPEAAQPKPKVDDDEGRPEAADDGDDDKGRSSAESLVPEHRK